MLNVANFIPEEIELMNVLVKRVNDAINGIEAALKTCDR